MFGQKLQPTVVIKVGMTEDQRVYASDFPLPQERRNDRPPRIKRLTRESACVNDHDVGAGKLDHGRITLSDIEKRDPQLSLKIALGQPIQDVTEHQAKQAGEKDSSQPGWLEV